MANNRELFKGNAQTIVLKLLSRNDMYGYQISQELTRLTAGGFQLTEGTLYPLLHGLEADRFVESYWEDGMGGQGARKRKFYRITDEGRGLLKKKQEEWELFRSGMDLVLSTEFSLT